jgi:hypothetical protein
MNQSISTSWVRCAFALLLGTVISVAAYANGSETLGVPSIPIASGSGIVVKGVGLELGQPGTINLTIPAGATIKQVLLYWEGQHTTPAGDNTIVVGGNPVTGALIGGPDYFFTLSGSLVYSSTYRADITTLGLVGAGPNAVSVQGLSFNFRNNGAGLLVIIDNGVVNSDIQLLDGNDLAYRFFPAPRTTTVPKTFTFVPSLLPRTANLAMFFSSATTVPEGVRPSRIIVTVGAVTTNYDDMLASHDGEEWDTFTTTVTIPPGATQVTVQAISGPGGDNDPSTPTPKPASLAWLAAGFTIPLDRSEGGEGCTPGYWKQCQHFDSWPSPYRPGTLFSAVFDNAFPGKTLLQVLWLGGGGLNALGRHTVAALLNGQSGGVDYDLSAAQVISSFNAAYPGSSTNYETLKNVFARYNEQGCPLNRTAAATEEEPTRAMLLQNYPNPFNPSTEIAFQLPEAGFVKIRIFNLLGQEVKMLGEGQFEAGVHIVNWDATDGSGSPVTSGIYFCQLQTGTTAQIIKMSLMR